MTCAIRYYTRSGNTKKLADGIEKVLDVKAETVAVNLENEVDTLFLGASIYGGRCHKSVLTFLENNKDKFKVVVVFGSSATNKTLKNFIKNWASKFEIKVSDKFFACPGSFMLMNKNRPNVNDIAACEVFAKRYLEKGEE